MATDPGAGTGAADSWTVLTYRNWEDEQELAGALVDALGGLDGVDDGSVLYEHVDIEAVVDLMAPELAERRASEVRFTYGEYEIRITKDGAIAGR